MADDLTFAINPETEAASMGLFLKALQDISRLLRDVDYAVNRERSSRRWIISGLQASSPAITVEPLLGDRETVDAIGDGIRAVTVGTDEPPQYFTEQALEDLRRMRHLFVGKDRARSIVVSVNSEQTATIDQDIADKATRILASGYRNLGSLEGTLEVINLHGTPTFTIWDRVSRAPVRCSFPSEPLWKNRVKEFLEKRVVVSGNIHYFVNGVPRRIMSLEEIRDATPDPALPKAEFGSIPDREAARDPVEFLRSIRGIAPE